MALVISMANLHAIGGKQHAYFRGTVNLVIQNGILYLPEEESLGNWLNEFRRNIFGEKLYKEFKEYGLFLLGDVLQDDLERKKLKIS